MLGQWLTAKKRGRDDEQIERDRAKAKEARRRNPIQKKAAKPKQPPPRKNRDREDSLAGFVVDDDKGEEVWEGSASSEEVEEVRNVDRLNKTKGATKQKKYDDSDSDDTLEVDYPKKKAYAARKDYDSDVSSAESETFFRPYKIRTSIPPPAVMQRGKVIKKVGPALKKKKKIEVENLCSSPSDVDDAVQRGKEVKKPGPAVKTTKKAKVQDLSSSSTGDGYAAAKDSKESVLLSKVKVGNVKLKKSAKVAVDCNASDHQSFKILRTQTASTVPPSCLTMVTTNRNSLLLHCTVI
jgi:hypothetical protein